MVSRSPSSSPPSPVRCRALSPTTTGILLKVLSTLVFAIMVILIKIVADRIPAGEVLFARAFFGTLPVVVWLAMRGEFPAALRTRQPIGHVRRAVVGTISMFSWFSAVSYLPLADATAINYSGPLFGVVFAALLLKEQVRAYRWSAVAVGFVGVLIVLSEQVQGFDLAEGGRGFGALLALNSAVFAALAMVSVRSLTATETTGAIVFYFSFAASVMALATIPFGWVMPTREEAVLLVAAGLAGGIGQVLMTESYRYAEASVIAPFDYANMIWIVVASYLLFDQLPTATVVVGSAIVIGSGIFVMWRESRLGLKRRRLPSQ